VARRARGDIATGTYHVTLRSAGPIELFRDDLDRTDFCHRLQKVVRAARWTCRAFCLMPTHYHLVLDVDENTLQPGMGRLNGGYAQNFNRRHGRWGHLCGDRYHAFPVQTDGHMLTLLRYLAHNPVVAGLCEKPTDWVWGSYRGCAELDAGFPFVSNQPLRAYFGSDRLQATRLLRSFVEDLPVGTVPREPF
jgi:REP element-mobilizing transposase RayT